MFKRKKVIMYLLLILLTTSFNHPSPALAENEQILLVYSTRSNEMNESVRYLQLLLQHFSKQVNVISDEDITKEDILKSTHIVYFGEVEAELSSIFLDALEKFTGTILAIGKNVEALPSFQFLQLEGHVTIHKIKTKTNVITFLKEVFQIPIIQTKADVLRWGMKGEEQFPLFIQNNTSYYFSASDILGDLSNILAECLHHVFSTHFSRHEAYIYIEDIHPATDEKNLLAIGDYFINKNIPFMLGVTPVYIDSNTGEHVRFSEHPEMIEALQYLQQNGGTVVLDGYHYTSQTDQAILPVTLHNSTFHTSSNSDNQTNTKSSDFLSNDIYELMQYGIYPLAFATTSNPMNSLDYERIAAHFSTIIGEIQLGDGANFNRKAPPFETWWKGMLVLPSTTAIDPNHPAPMQEVKQAINHALLVRDSMIGIFYHPSFGVKYLPAIVETIENINGVKWVDLKQQDHIVHTEKITIQSSQGSIHVFNQLNTWDKLLLTVQPSILEYFLWGGSLFVFLVIVIFVLYSLFLRLTLRKRLFQERKPDG